MICLQSRSHHVPPRNLGALKISSRQITLLNALGEFGNLRRAATAMHTTQPAASLLLQQLEERLGVRLFERLPRGMQPTLYGEVMIRYAQGALHEFEHAQAQIAELARGAMGLVRVGSVMGPVPTLLTKAVLAYKRDHPKVRISIEVGTSDTLLPALLRGDFDVVLGRLPDQSDSQDLDIELFDNGEQMRVIARVGHPLAGAVAIAVGRPDHIDLDPAPHRQPHAPPGGKCPAGRRHGAVAGHCRNRFDPGDHGDARSFGHDRGGAQ